MLAVSAARRSAISPLHHLALVNCSARALSANSTFPTPSSSSSSSRSISTSQVSPSCSRSALRRPKSCSSQGLNPARSTLTTRFIHASSLSAAAKSTRREAKMQDTVSERTSAGSVESTHFRDKGPKPVVPAHDHHSQPTGITGDWVLFHPVYTEPENKSVKVLYRVPKTMSDRVATTFGAILRWGFDFVSRYKHKEIPEGSKLSVKELREQGYTMNDSQWLARILFLESIAGVPGMVAAALRHLRSLRSMERDNAWIHTLLQEAENERMHLMTFMTLKKPSIWFRAMILGAQGVFYNVFFLAYLVSPKTCHRFVGCLEEQAVYTYTGLIDDLENGRLPEWADLPAPPIAIEYWRLPKDAKLLDVIYAVRSDESTHRFVNHSLASLKPTDVNPFAMGEPSMSLKGTKIGFEREESYDYVVESQRALEAEVEKRRLQEVANTRSPSAPSSSN